MADPEVKPEEVKPEPAAPAASEKMSTGTKIAIGVGAILVIGGCYYAYTKWSAPEVAPEQSI